MRRDERIMVFRSTMELIEKDKSLSEMTASSIKRQQVMKTITPLQDQKGQSPGRNGIVRLSQDRSFQAAMRHPAHHTATLNFASWKNPGGGVENGASAQEESLCRISNLYCCLTDERMMREFYIPHRNMRRDGMYNDDMIYTPDVIIVRRDDSRMEILPENLRFKSDVITMAAPNLNSVRNPEMLDLDEVYRTRLGKVLAAAYENGADTVVLGAFGCGVFCNDPKRVAGATADVLNSVRTWFDTIEIPVFCTGDTSNYDAFERVFRKNGIRFSY